MLTNSNNDEIPWAYLPPIVITHIFSLLMQSDRLNASTVCRHWHIAFHSPELWTSAVIRFEGKLSSPMDESSKFYTGPRKRHNVLLNLKNEKAIMFAETNGRYLKNLWFKVYLGTEEMKEEECVNLMSLIKQFFEKIADNKCELQKLQMDCDLYSCNWKPELKESFVDMWIQFLTNQTHLKMAHFECWWEHFVPFTESLVNGSGTSLQSMKFNLEVESIPELETTQEKYLSLFAKMPKLETLDIPKDCFNHLVLSNFLAHNSSLKCIKHHCDSPLELLMPPHIETPSAQLQMAAKRYPGFQIKMCVGSPVELGCVCFVLSFVTSPTSVREVSVTIDVYVDVSQREVHNKHLFNFIKNIFKERLETFNYSDFRPIAMEESTPYLKHLLLSCPKLRNLNLYIFKDEPLSYIEDICKMQVEKEIDIRNLRIEYCSSNAEDESKLNEIFQLYKDQLGKRNWKFHFTYKST